MTGCRRCGRETANPGLDRYCVRCEDMIQDARQEMAAERREMNGYEDEDDEEEEGG